MLHYYFYALNFSHSNMFSNISTLHQKMLINNPAYFKAYKMKINLKSTNIHYIFEIIYNSVFYKFSYQYRLEFQAKQNSN